MQEARFRFLDWLLDWLLSLQDFPFDWDAGNETRSLQKHSITCEEAEEVFATRLFVPLGEQIEPFPHEPRYGLLGETATGKALFLVFTIRKERIRVISVRPMNAKEKKFYASLRKK